MQRKEDHSVREKPVLPVVDGPLYRLFLCGESRGPSRPYRHNMAMDAMEIQGAWVMTLSGCGYYEEGSHVHRLEAGSVLALHRPARGVLVNPGDPESWKIIWVHVVGKQALELFDFIVSRYGILHQLSIKSPVVSKARKLVRMTRAKELYSVHEWSLRTYDFLNTWWACAEEEAPKGTAVLKSAQYDSRVLSYHPGSVQQFAHKMGYSRSYLSRKLKQQWKEPPGQVLRRARLDEAAHLLRTTNLKVKHVGMEVGYQSTTAFNRAFKQAFGASPLAYRHQER